MSEYNGWANYETWAAKLWLDNDRASQEYWAAETRRCVAVAADKHPNEFMDAEGNRRLLLVEALQAYHEQYLAEWLPSDQASVFTDLVGSALGHVDWYEIARSMLAEINEID